MFINPTKEQIENIPEIKKIYDYNVRNFGKENVDKDFCVLLCDKCGKPFDCEIGWNLENNTNYTGTMQFDLCEECGKDLIVNNIKPYIKSPLYNQIVKELKKI